jgi:type I restriction enzyme, S subunit
VNVRGFLDNLEVLVEAPGGIQRARDLILNLAVRGKLVPQDTNDDPAISIISHIHDHNLVKPVKNLDSDDLGEPPWLIPASWEWVPLRSIVDFEIGKTPATRDSSLWADNGDGHAWVSIADMAHYGSVNTSSRRVSAKSEHETFKSDPKQIGTMIMSFKLTIGKIARLKIPAYHNEAIISVFPGVEQLDPFLFWFLPKFALATNANAAIKGATLNKASLTKLLVALPPLQEQQRIVAKIDELMAHLDALEASREQRIEHRTALRDSALAALQDAEDDRAVDAAWQRIADNMDDLFTEPEDVEPLRQTILQLAVRGRLVPQNSDTIEVTESTIRSHVKFLNGYAFKSGWYADKGIKLLRNQNVSHDTIDWSDTKYLPAKMANEFERFSLYENDIVLSLDRPFISTGLKLARVQASDLPALLLQRVACPRITDAGVDADYLYLWFQSPEFERQADPGRSNGVPHISTKAVEKMAFNIYPLEYQRQVVETASTLLRCADELESNIQNTRKAQEAYAGAVVHHLDTIINGTTPEEDLAGDVKLVQVEDAWELQVAQISWPHPHEPELEWATYRQWDAEPSEYEVAEAKARLFADTDYCGHCEMCGDWCLAGHMHDDSTCQGCAERYLGVVH